MKPKRTGRFARRAGSARVSVRLSVTDWMAIAGFTTGDLHNMEDSEIKRQMTRIVDAIHRSVAKSPNATGSATEGGP